MSVEEILNGADIVGRVKFFDSKKGFGYITKLDNAQDCFAHASQILSLPITDNDIVIFKTVPSRKKAGESDAVEINSHLPVYIFNKEGTSKSSVVILSDDHLAIEKPLTTMLIEGFYIATLNQRPTGWEATLLPLEDISQKGILHFSEKLIIKLIVSPEDYKSILENLYTLLEEGLPTNTLNALCNQILDLLESKSISSLNGIAKALKGSTLFDRLMDQRKSIINKINFVLWARGELEKLPNPVNQDQENLWRNEILPHLDDKTLQQVLLKLLPEAGPTPWVRETYEYLLEYGWQIKSAKDLEPVIDFLADVITGLDINGSTQYLSDLFHILSVLRYSRSGSLLPSGIEAYLLSVEGIAEADIQSQDKKIFEEFEETRKVRELKLIAIEVLSGLAKNGKSDGPQALRLQQDTFIKKYFAADSLETLLHLLQDQLAPNDPLLVKWRGMPSRKRKIN